METLNLYDSQRRAAKKKKRQMILLLCTLGLLLFFIFFMIWLVFREADRLMRHPGDSFNYVAENILPPYEEVSFNSYASDLKLSAWYFPASGTARANVLIVPGREHNRLLFGLSSVELYRFFQEKGFNCLAYDPRHRGLSDGKRSSYGYREYADVLGALDCLHRQSGGLQNVVIYAESSGTAAALYAWDALGEIKDSSLTRKDIRALILDQASKNTSDYITDDLECRTSLERLLYPSYVPSALRLASGAKQNPALTPLICQVQAPVFLTYPGRLAFSDRQRYQVPANERARLNPESTVIWESPNDAAVAAFLADSKTYLQQLEIFLDRWLAVKSD